VILGDAEEAVESKSHVVSWLWQQLWGVAQEGGSAVARQQLLNWENETE
jgi:hypothetical protein